MNKYKGIIFAILSSVAFGLMPIFAKVAYNNGSNTSTVLSFRFLVAAIILFIFGIITKTSFKVSKKQLITLILIGSLGYTFTTETLFLSYRYMSVGLATTIHFIYPAFVCIFSFLVFKEKLSKNKVGALILSAVGVYLLVGVSNSGINLKGVGLALVSGVSYSCCILSMNNKAIKTLDNKVMTFYFSLFAGSTITLLSYFNGGLTLHFNRELIFSYFGLSVVSTIIATILLIKAVKVIGATSASILGTFEPIVSLILGVALFNESITSIMIFGTILILFSVIIISMESKDKKENKGKVNLKEENAFL